LLPGSRGVLKKLGILAFVPPSMVDPTVKTTWLLDLSTLALSSLVPMNVLLPPGSPVPMIFSSTDGIQYTLSDFNALYSGISTTYSEKTGPGTCDRRVSNGNSGNVSIQSATLELKPAQNQAEISLSMTAPVTAQIFNSVCSGSTTQSGTSSASLNVTAAVRFAENDPEPTPTPTPTPGPSAFPPPDCTDQILAPTALNGLMTGLNSLGSASGFSTQSLKSDEIQSFAKSQKKLNKLREQLQSLAYPIAALDTPDMTRAQAPAPSSSLKTGEQNRIHKWLDEYFLVKADKELAKANYLVKLAQQEAVVQALWQMGTEEFGVFYGPYAGPVRDTDFLQYKTMADEAAYHFDTYLSENNTHGLFYASQAHLNEVAIFAHVARRYFAETLVGLSADEPDDFFYANPSSEKIETVLQLLRRLEKNIGKHGPQLQKQHQQLGAEFAKLLAEEAQLMQELDASEQRITALFAEHEQIAQSLQQLDDLLAEEEATGGFGIQSQFPDPGDTRGIGAYPFTHEIVARHYMALPRPLPRVSPQRQNLQNLKQSQTNKINHADAQISQLQARIKQTTSPLQKNNLQAQLKTYRQLKQNLQQKRNDVDKELKNLEKVEKGATKNQDKQTQQGSSCRAADLRKLSKGEENALKRDDRDAVHKIKEDIVGKKNKAQYDLYKDRNGDIFVVRKHNPKGTEPQPTWLNINDYMGR